MSRTDVLERRCPPNLTAKRRPWTDRSVDLLFSSAVKKLHGCSRLNSEYSRKKKQKTHFKHIIMIKKKLILDDLSHVTRFDFSERNARQAWDDCSEICRYTAKPWDVNIFQINTITRLLLVISLFLYPHVIYDYAAYLISDRDFNVVLFIFSQYFTIC